MRNLLKRCRIAHESNKNQWYNKRRRTRADNFFRSTVKAHYQERILPNLGCVVKTLSLPNQHLNVRSTLFQRFLSTLK